MCLLRVLCPVRRPVTTLISGISETVLLPVVNVVGRSNMFRVAFHPSQGAHDTVSAVSGISETVLLPVVNVVGRKQQVAVTVSLMPHTVDTVL
jgi:transcriptional regulator of nitric oxide reductase